MLGSPEHCARALGRQVWSVLKCGDWMGVFGKVENVRLPLGFQLWCVVAVELRVRGTSKDLVKKEEARAWWALELAEQSEAVRFVREEAEGYLSTCSWLGQDWCYSHC